MGRNVVPLSRYLRAVQEMHYRW